MNRTYAFFLCAMTSLMLLQMTAQTTFAGEGEQSMKSIKGSVWYRERMLPPVGAEILISLVDVARMDVAADVIASKTVAATGGPPWDFVLEYDPAAIHSKGRYALKARLEADGRLFFITTSHIAAFDHDPEEGVEILLSRVSNKDSNAKARHKPDSTLVNTHWKLVEIAGNPVGSGAGGKELYMVLDSLKSRVKGFAGCNNFSGGFEQKENKITFGPLLATMMACIEGMEEEQQFLQALEKTQHFAIKGETLVVYDGEDQRVLRFTAVYLQ